MGSFLRDRRDRLTPAQAGLAAFPGPRRVPGLRKEELAALAGLSPDYYSKLEQGRQTHASRAVLDALARALHLDDVECAHLRDLAAAASQRREPVVEPVQRADPGLLRMMAVLEHVPVLLLGHRGDVLARNALVAELLGSDLSVGSSFFRYLFQAAQARERILNWEVFAQAAVAGMRRERGRRPHDRQLDALISELLAEDPAVAAWWEDHAVRDYASMTKHIRHPAAGDLCFGVEVVVASGDVEQRLVVYTVEPGSTTAIMLPLVASRHSRLWTVA